MGTLVSHTSSCNIVLSSFIKKRYKGPDKCVELKLASNTKYTFRVRAENVAGKSDYVTFEKDTTGMKHLNFNCCRLLISIGEESDDEDQLPTTRSIPPLKYVQVQEDEDEEDDDSDDFIGDDDDDIFGTPIQSISAVNSVELPDVYLTADQYQKAIMVIHETLYPSFLSFFFFFG